MLNLFADIPADLAEERVEMLLQSSHVRIERIVSRGQASPAGFWYDQDNDEYVVLISGSAGLRIEGEGEGRDEIINLKPGDTMLIPAHQRHRVEWTEAGRDTIWLAIHLLK